MPFLPPSPARFHKGAALVLGLAALCLHSARADEAAADPTEPAMPAAQAAPPRPAPIVMPPPDPALYARFGGEAGIARITDDFIAKVFADPRTSPYFANASVKRLRAKLAEHFCAQVGGPCKYTGSSMKNVHSYLKIDRSAFNAVVEDLQDAMDRNGVPFRAQNVLLARLAPLHRDIETR